jgi:hypothetical protein
MNEPLEITIAPPSSDFDRDELLAHLNHDPADGDVAGCGYCETRPLMKALYDAYFSGDKAKRALIYALADGYGEPGTIPPQGYDWSGVRDSTPAATRRMAAALMAYEAQG